MTTEKKEAENLWGLYIDRKAGYINPMQSARETLSDYKAALRDEIEKRKLTLQDSLKKSIFRDSYLRLYAMIQECNDLLQLLDTVTPKEK